MSNIKINLSKRLLYGYHLHFQLTYPDLSKCILGIFLARLAHTRITHVTLLNNKKRQSIHLMKQRHMLHSAAEA